MIDTPEEIPLAGGNVSRPVRIGNTVWKPASPQGETVRRLLLHARSRGIDFVPEPLGTDRLGREGCTFLPGEVPHDEPGWLWNREILRAAARFLRRWHDAAADFPREGAVWGFASGEPDQTICHNDFAPYNCVFDKGRLTGVIDFDICSPGSRLWDIAYTAYRFVPVYPERFDPDRLELFLSTYAEGRNDLTFTADLVLDRIAERLTALEAWTRNHARETGNEALGADAELYRRHREGLRPFILSPIP